jgi:hypothetical protein
MPELFQEAQAHPKAHKESHSSQSKQQAQEQRAIEETDFIDGRVDPMTTNS